MKVFNFDEHPSVINDVKHVLLQLYGDRIELTRWCVHQKLPNNDVILGENWHHLDRRMITEFQEKNEDFLRTFDAFIVTHTPSFTLLFEKYGKPIILVNSWRYEIPFGWIAHNMWPVLNRALQRMQQKGQLIAVSNNRADRLYLLVGTGVDSVHIPSLCSYSQAVHNPQRPELVVYRNNGGLFPPSPKLVGHMSWLPYEQLFAFKAIVHVPYEISTMSIFEQITAGVPLFFPTKRFYKECVESGLMENKSRRATVPPPKSLFAFFDSLDVWLNNADYYTQHQPFAHKFVYYYDSFSDMVAQAEVFDETPEVVKARSEWLAARKETILSEWRRLLDPVFAQQKNVQ